MEAHFSDPENPISIIGFLSTFKRVCDTNDIPEGVAMLVLSHYVKEILANSLNSRMCAENRLPPFVAFVSNKEMRRGKLLRSYPQIVDYLFKKYKTDKAIVENDVAILLYVQPTNTTPHHYADDSTAKSCNLADMYDESTLNDVLIESIEASIRNSLRHV